MKVTAQSYNSQNQNKTTSSYVLNKPTIDRLLNRINLLSYKLYPCSIMVTLVAMNTLYLLKIKQDTLL